MSRETQLPQCSAPSRGRGPPSGSTAGTPADPGGRRAAEIPCSQAGLRPIRFVATAGASSSVNPALKQGPLCMVRAKLSALHPQDVIHHMAGHLGDTPRLGGTCPSHTPAPTHARGHLTPQAASPLSNRDLGGLHPCWDVSSGCGHPGTLSWALRATDRAAQLGPKLSNSSAKLQNRLETGPVGVTSYKQEDIGQLGAAPPLASRRGHSGSRPWEAMVSTRPPPPSCPPHSASSPLGLSFPSIMRQWGPSTQAASPHP